MVSADDVNAAIAVVERAKARHPIGWAFLNDVGLSPSDSFMVYAFKMAAAHAERLGREEDGVVVYATGWLQGLAVGYALAHEEDARA